MEPMSPKLTVSWLEPKVNSSQVVSHYDMANCKALDYLAKPFSAREIVARAHMQYVGAESTAIGIP